MVFSRIFWSNARKANGSKENKLLLRLLKIQFFDTLERRNDKKGEPHRKQEDFSSEMMGVQVVQVFTRSFRRLAVTSENLDEAFASFPDGSAKARNRLQVFFGDMLVAKSLTQIHTNYMDTPPFCMPFRSVFQFHIIVLGRNKCHFFLHLMLCMSLPCHTVWSQKVRQVDGTASSLTRRVFRQETWQDVLVAMCLSSC